MNPDTVLFILVLGSKTVDFTMLAFRRVSTVCAQASNGAAGGCQSGINGPESEPERITISVF